VTSSYDIFEMIAGNDLMWIEAVEDLSTAKKRLVSLASSKLGDYCVSEIFFCG